MPTTDPKVMAKKTMSGMESSSPGSGWSDTVQVGAKGATIPMLDPKVVVETTMTAMEGTKETLDVTPDPKAEGKRTVTGSSDSSPPHKRFHSTWTC
jgi:hypothetical protein